MLPIFEFMLTEAIYGQNEASELSKHSRTPGSRFRRESTAAALFIDNVNAGLRHHRRALSIQPLKQDVSLALKRHLELQLLDLKSAFCKLIVQVERA
ncbi:hypothetical protein Zmor_002200 [Zophobas morio]|uniref:Uncharacterized protein n=1 Tax=Zophobas morio TaxID=2755281 RepID=A0AA38J5Y0_9CUCU|nr:hypothetical protein Zmor_002200 [Zophobas morio]